MTKKIVSFGDSFIFGNEISDNEDGSKAWPGLASQDLNCSYETRAVPGCGNEDIARQIYSYFSKHDVKDTIAVINWTWAMRWDFHLADRNIWITLGPTCVPEKLFSVVQEDEANKLIRFYQQYTGISDVWNRYRSLQAIYAAQCWMHTHGIKTCQTYIDPMLLDKNSGNKIDHYRAYRDPSWPDLTNEADLELLPLDVQQEILQDYDKHKMPDYVMSLQTAVGDRLKTFDGMTFLEWSYHNKFPVTELLHPLEQAHRSAADFWREHYAFLFRV